MTLLFRNLKYLAQNKSYIFFDGVECQDLTFIHGKGWSSNGKKLNGFGKSLRWSKLGSEPVCELEFEIFSPSLESGVTVVV